MQELSLAELETESIELLPRREALSCSTGTPGGINVGDVQSNEQYGLVNVNALNFNHSGLVVVG